MQWFIFTSRGGLTIAEGDGITQAVAAFRRLKQPNAGEVIGVIKAATKMEAYGQLMPTPVFGVICCVAEAPRNTAPTMQAEKQN